MDVMKWSTEDNVGPYVVHAQEGGAKVVANVTKMNPSHGEPFLVMYTWSIDESHEGGEDDSEDFRWKTQDGATQSVEALVERSENFFKRINLRYEKILGGAPVCVKLDSVVSVDEL